MTAEFVYINGSDGRVPPVELFMCSRGEYFVLISRVAKQLK